MGAALQSDAPASDLMHSRREGVVNTQRIKSSFSWDAKNCLTRYVRNYSVRSACGTRSKSIKADSWELILTGSAIQIKLRDGSRHRNELPVAFRQRLIDQFAHSTGHRQSQASDFDHSGTFAYFERHLTVIGRDRPLHFTTATKCRREWRRPPYTFLVRTSYVIMATKTGPHAVSTMLPIA